jgi:hypothetical protein
VFAHDGKLRSTLSLEPDGSPALVFAQGGETRSALRLEPDGAPVLAFLHDGQTRSTLKLQADGSPLLEFPADGKVKSSLRLQLAGAPLLAFLQDGQVRSALKLETDGSPALEFPEDGKIKSSLRLEPDGTPTLQLAGLDSGGVHLTGSGLGLHGREGNKRAVLALGPDDSPGLVFINREDGSSPQVALILGEAGPRLVFYDRSGAEERAPIRLGLGPSGDQPKIQLRDENGRERAVLGHVSLKGTSSGQVQDRPASSLVLFDRDGKVIWRAP